MRVVATLHRDQGRARFPARPDGIIVADATFRTDPETAMKATWNGVVIAESDDTVVVEGNHYFPEAALRREYITASDHRSHCPWKGEARYYSLDVGGKANPDAVWYYPDPKPAAAQIKGRVAFWKGVVVAR
jgi:uncharacterized protein (DUF427 family)